ncbi:MAG: hypothetical protein OEQ13_01870 [Acidobacteriota bacterium]|nr:hypothetical protein [Acidobacteriota bacterium]
MAGIGLIGASLLLISTTTIPWGSGPHRGQLPASAAGTCLACHDGARARYVTAREAGRMQIVGGVSVNHPIGMDYERHVGERPKHFHPIGALPDSVRFVDGRVSCVSCHRENSATPGAGDCLATGELAVGPRETDLCLACHAM